MLHTATLILCWAVTAVALQRIDGLPLAAIAGFTVAAVAGAGASRRFAGILRRSRWLLVAVALLHLLPPSMASGWQPDAVAGGGLAGIEQALRLVVLLALLAVVLHQRTREELVSGIHMLLAPFAWLGVDRGRFAARLCLTLAYFDRPRPEGERRGVAEALAELDRAPDTGGSVIVLPARRLGLADGVAVVLIGLGLGAALL
ncbi:MAG TPA: hypothetical protein VLW45_12070 [Pelomicrobium sp.]|nr:hypothetical protein [Pelomicrobium sp.]